MDSFTHTALAHIHLHEIEMEEKLSVLLEKPIGSQIESHPQAFEPIHAIANLSIVHLCELKRYVKIAVPLT